jgi:hypothetical protein
MLLLRQQAHASLPAGKSGEHRPAPCAAATRHPSSVRPPSRADLAASLLLHSPGACWVHTGERVSVRAPAVHPPIAYAPTTRVRTRARRAPPADMP